MFSCHFFSASLLGVSSSCFPFQFPYTLAFWLSLLLVSFSYSYICFYFRFPSFLFFFLSFAFPFQLNQRSVIFSAFSIKGTNERHLIEVICNRTLDQRMKVAQVGVICILTCHSAGACKSGFPWPRLPTVLRPPLVFILALASCFFAGFVYQSLGLRLCFLALCLPMFLARFLVISLTPPSLTPFSHIFSFLSHLFLAPFSYVVLTSFPHTLFSPLRLGLPSELPARPRQGHAVGDKRPLQKDPDHVDADTRRTRSAGSTRSHQGEIVRHLSQQCAVVRRCATHAQRNENDGER